MKKRVRIYKPGGNTFEPHMMYDPNQDFKGFEARVPEDHERMSEMGYVHEDEMQQMLEQQRKQFGGKVRKALKKEFATGGSNAMQGTDTNDFAKNRTGMFKNFMSNSAKQQIAQEEAMNFYDQMQNQQQFNWGGFNNKASWSPDDYLTRNQENVNLINMYGTQANKTKQGVSDAFSRIGNMAYDVINNYDPYNVTTKVKTKIMKPYRKEYRAAKKDYRQDVRDWRNDIDKGMVSGAPMPEFNFTPGGMDLTARYGMEVPYDQYGGNFTPYEDVSGMLPTYRVAGETEPDWPPVNRYAQEATDAEFDGVNDEMQANYGYKPWYNAVEIDDDGDGIADRSVNPNMVGKDLNANNKSWTRADYYAEPAENFYNHIREMKNSGNYSTPMPGTLSDFPIEKVQDRGVRVNPDDRDYWDYGGPDPNKAREDDKAQYMFEEWSYPPDNFMYKDEALGINNIDDYYRVFGVDAEVGSNRVFDHDAARAYRQKKVDEYFKLPHEEKLKYDPNATLMKPDGRAVRDKQGWVVKGKEGLKYNEKGEYKGDNKSKSNKGKSGNGNSSAEAADRQLKGDTDKSLVQNEGTDGTKRGSGNVKYEDEFPADGSSSRTTTTTTTDGKGNVFVPRQSWQLGPGSYRDGMYRGFGQAPPMIAYNPENTYLDYFKHRGRGLFRPDKTVMKFSHYAPGAMPNMTTEQINQYNQQMQDQGAGQPSVDDIIDRETQGMSKGDARKTARNIRRANRQGMLEDFMTDEERGINAGPDAAPTEEQIKNEEYRKRVKDVGKILLEDIPAIVKRNSQNAPDNSAVDPQNAPAVSANNRPVPDNINRATPTDAVMSQMAEIDRQARADAESTDEQPTMVDANSNEIPDYLERDSQNAPEMGPQIENVPSENIQSETVPSENVQRKGSGIFDNVPSEDELWKMLDYSGRHPRQGMTSEEGMRRLLWPEKGNNIGAFTKETKKGDRKFNWKEMRDEGFSRKEVRNMKRAVKDYDDNVKATGNPEFAMNTIDRAYEDANKSRTRRFMGKEQYGGVPMYYPGGVTPEPVEGLDMSQSVFTPMMASMNQNIPPMSYPQPEEYYVNDNMGGQGTPLNMPVINGPTPEQKKWAETTMKRKFDRFGLRSPEQWAKFLPAAGQAIAGIGRGLTEPDNEAEIIRRTDAMSSYTPDRTWSDDKGMNAFNPVGVTPRITSPVQYTGGAYGQYGGQFRHGGTYMLSDDDIRQVLAMGGSIEYLD